jgi:cystathionine beta-lyase
MERQTGKKRAPYNFDELINRRGTNCIKFDWAEKRGFPPDVIPLWVADMDFRSPDEVIEALVAAARHGVFGYSDAGPGYFEAIRSWFDRRFGFQLREDWLVRTAGVVYSLNMAIRAFSREGDHVLIQSPVYPPFHSSVTDNGRKVSDNTLVYRDGAYSIDLLDFERKLKQGRIKLFLLCSPHNPVGRVWDPEELSAMGELCLKHGCVVVADEIHCDFVWGGREHRVFPSLGEAFQKNTVLLTAPTKTFNLAALHNSNVFIPNPALRQRFQDEVARSGISQLSVMGLVACQAAYEHGEGWFEELKAYLAGNIRYTEDFFRANLKGLSLVETQGTYLMWADFSDLFLDHKELKRLLKEKARVWLSDGLTFGVAGRNFQRINVAAPRRVIHEGLERISLMLRDL